MEELKWSPLPKAMIQLKHKSILQLNEQLFDLFLKGGEVEKYDQAYQMMMNFVIPALTSLQKDESYIADHVREKWFNLFASDTISTLQQGKASDKLNDILAALISEEFQIPKPPLMAKVTLQDLQKNFSKCLAFIKGKHVL